LSCSQAEISEFERFAQQGGVHNLLFDRIAPNIFGSEDIKKAVACLLFGGSRKVGIVMVV
jgi:DNA replication licensing factor MCM5